jgi:hypothetical protein
LRKDAAGARILPLVRRRRSFATGAVLWAALLGLILAVPAAQAAGTRIASPHDGRFFARAPVRVTVHAARSARSLRATLDGRSVSRAFHRAGAGVWRARLGSKQLRAGVNHLRVVSRDRAGRLDRDAVRFVLGKRRRRLLALRGPGRHLVSVARVRSGATTLRARLNGHRLRWPLAPWLVRSQALRLGADDGLHFGTNRLRVFAARRNGTFDVERRTVRVPRTRPLPGAGPDRRAAAGSGIRLNGRSSRAARRGAGLRYSWRIVRRPRGSKTALRWRHSARPALRPDVAGTYRVRLTVTETRRRQGGGRLSRSSADVVTVRAVEELPPIGMPVETISWNGGDTEETIDTGIRLGSKTYWLGMPQGNSVQAVILERGTLEVLYSASYPGSQSDAETLAAKVHGFGNKALVLISNPAVLPNSEVNPGFVKIVKGLGVSVSTLELGRAGWSAIGIPESKGGGYLGSGLSFQDSGVADLRGNLDGYLQVDSNDGFNFVPGARVSFDTSVPSQAKDRNAIQVGDRQYASEPLAGCGTGGFQVQVVLAETLAAAAGQTFTTNGCGTAEDAKGQQTLADFLAAVNLAGGSSEGPKLVFVQSIGEPRDASAGNWVAIAQQLGRLGGTEAVFAEHGGSYALVGTLGVSNPPLEESSSALTGKPARISGVLKPDRLDSFVPVLASPTGSTPFTMSTIAYQAPQAWPHSQTAGEKAALGYIAEDVLDLDKPTLNSACYVPPKPDVRSEYCNLAYRGKWTAWAGKLERRKYEAGHGFSEEDWKNVVEELAPAEGFGEFEAVQTVWSLVTTLQGAIGASAVTGEVNLKKIALEVEEALKPPAKSEAAGWWLEFLANIAAIASYYDFGLEDEVVQKTTGAISGVLFIAAQWQAGPEGSPVFEHWKLSADEVAVQMAKNYRAASNGIGRVGELIVSDYGKLKAVARDPNLALNAKAVATTAETLESGAKQWSYGALLPVAYEAVSLRQGEQQNNPLPKNASEYSCEFYEAGGGSGAYHPFGSAPEAAQYRTELPAPTLGVLVVNGSELPVQGDPEEHPRSPTAKLIEPLFAAPEKGGLGLYTPWFWRTAFGYGSSQTKSVLCR